MGDETDSDVIYVGNSYARCKTFKQDGKYVASCYDAVPAFTVSAYDPINNVTINSKENILETYSFGWTFYVIDNHTSYPVA